MRREYLFLLLPLVPWWLPDWKPLMNESGRRPHPKLKPHSERQAMRDT